jgi:hypothetical protein
LGKKSFRTLHILGALGGHPPPKKNKNKNILYFPIIFCVCLKHPFSLEGSREELPPLPELNRVNVDLNEFRKYVEL